jgi:hypothetical protein
MTPFKFKTIDDPGFDAYFADLCARRSAQSWPSHASLSGRMLSLIEEWVDCVGEDHPTVQAMKDAAKEIGNDETTQDARFQAEWEAVKAVEGFAEYWQKGVDRMRQANIPSLREPLSLDRV